MSAPADWQELTPWRPRGLCSRGDDDCPCTRLGTAALYAYSPAGPHAGESDDQPLDPQAGGFVALSEEEKQAIEAACEQVVVRHAGEDLIHEGERPHNVHLLIDGWAFRYKLLPDGGRQIMAYLIPGDLCEIHIFILKRMDHSIGLLSDSRVGLIPEQAMVELMDTHPRVARALFWATLVDEATLREWLANTLRREPFERVAHLLSEMWLRMREVGLVSPGDAFDLPLTQAELGDTIGLNAVTVNRVLQRLRAEDLITLKGERLTLLDPERLMAVSGFDPNYLHLGMAGRQPDALHGAM